MTESFLCNSAIEKGPRESKPERANCFKISHTTDSPTGGGSTWQLTELILSSFGLVIEVENFHCDHKGHNVCCNTIKVHHPSDGKRFVSSF